MADLPKLEKKRTGGFMENGRHGFLVARWLTRISHLFLPFFYVDSFYRVLRTLPWALGGKAKRLSSYQDQDDGRCQQSNLFTVL